MLPLHFCWHARVAATAGRGCWGFRENGECWFSKPRLFSLPLVQCSLLMKWQLGAGRRIRANIVSLLQLKHHHQNCLSLSVVLSCAITNLTILENAGSENGFSISNFCLQFWVSVNTAGLEMRIDSLFSESWLGKYFLSLEKKGCWYAVLLLSMQNSH